MHGTRNGLKPVVSGSCLFAYWLFHAITFERKGLSKIHTKNQEKPIIYPYVPEFERRNERCWRWSTHTQDKYRNPPAHARRGLINLQNGASNFGACVIPTMHTLYIFQSIVERKESLLVEKV